MEEKLEVKLKTEDIGTFFHGILFAYQKTVDNILGSGAAVFVHPVLDVIKTINKRSGVNMLQGRNLDEVFENLSRIMPTSGAVKGFHLEKTGPSKYVLHVEGCFWAPHIHSELKPQDVTCPFALIAMSIFEEMSKQKVKVAGSQYLKDGTKTIIEPL